MTPLPSALGALGSSDLVVWRLETTKHLATWITAEGAFLFGGRWSSVGHRVIYTAVDPSTAIIEVAVHKGLPALDGVPHTLLGITINAPKLVHVVDVATIPNAAWLRPGAVSAGQQAFGDALLAEHPLVIVPSVVSPRSWNLLIHLPSAAGLFELRSSEPFALDTRLNPPAA